MALCFSAALFNGICLLENGVQKGGEFRVFAGFLAFGGIEAAAGGEEGCECFAVAVTGHWEWGVTGVE